MIIAAVVAAAAHQANLAAYCVQNNIPISDPPEPDTTSQDAFAKSTSPLMWLPMFLIGLLG